MQVGHGDRGVVGARRVGGVFINHARPILLHLRLAPTQPPADHGWSQIGLFYAESAVSILAALLVLISGRRWSYVLAALVAASALGAVLLSRYVDIGALGPLPNLYEPAWYPTKVITTIAETVALVAAVTATVSRPAAGTNRSSPAMHHDSPSL